MIYRFEISTKGEGKYTITNKKKTVLRLCRGVIHQIDIRFPPGPQGYLKLHINRAAHQVWPSPSGQYFATDNEPISFREHYELVFAPLQLEAWTWNDDDTYEHLVIIRLGILPRKFVLRRLF